RSLPSAYAPQRAFPPAPGPRASEGAGSRATTSSHLSRGREHLVGRSDNLGIQFVAALRLDQVGDLAHRIYGAVLEEPLTQSAGPVFPWSSDRRGARSRSLEEEVGADRL